MINWHKHWTEKKPRKASAVIQARIKRNKDIEPKSAKRMSYRKFWRRQQGRLQKFEKKSSRRQRRQVAWFLWHRIVKKQT